LLSLNCDEVAEIFNKFQKEIEAIQKMINTNKNNDKNIDLVNLNKLIDEENEDIESQNSEIKKNSEGNGSNKPMELCIKNISEKIGDSRSKFLSLVNSYYNSLTHINKKIKEKEKLHNSINDLNNNLFKEILPNLPNFEQIVNHYQKKIDKSKTDDEILFYLNRLIGDIINKLKDTTSDQKNEIERLHDRVEYFLGQYANMKKTQEIIANEERNSHAKILQKKQEEINKMKKKLGEKEKVLDEKDNEKNDLTDQLLNIKEKYKIKENDFEAFLQKAKEESSKNDIKDLNYGKHNFSIFYEKVREFAGGLYNYTGLK
jgi:chromosome segregation ATPase